MKLDTMQQVLFNENSAGRLGFLQFNGARVDGSSNRKAHATPAAPGRLVSRNELAAKDFGSWPLRVPKVRWRTLALNEFFVRLHERLASSRERVLCCKYESVVIYRDGPLFGLAQEECETARTTFLFGARDHEKREQ